MTGWITQAQYNQFVRLVQEEAPAFGLEVRLRAENREPGRIDGYLEVFWDRWQVLASETDAMTPECRREIRSPTSTTWSGIPLWEAIKAEAGAALAKG